MDIQHLVDRLEDLVDEGRHMPFSKFTMVDEERALEIIDQMRISIPEEIEKASRVLAQRDRILAAANEEAARIIQQAREQVGDRPPRDAGTRQGRSNIPRTGGETVESDTRSAGPNASNHRWRFFRAGGPAARWESPRRRRPRRCVCRG